MTVPSSASYADKEASARALSQRKQNFSIGYHPANDKANSFHVKASGPQIELGRSNQHTMQLAIKLNGQKPEYTSIAKLQQNQAR